jgi:hypothetical protein
VKISCTSGVPAGVVEQTDTAGKSGLQYSPATRTYTYVWKTPKSLKGCYRFELRLKDGSVHSALFKF